MRRRKRRKRKRRIVIAPPHPVNSIEVCSLISPTVFAHPVTDVRTPYCTGSLSHSPWDGRTGWLGVKH